MVKIRTKISCIVFFFFLNPFVLFSQGKINVPGRECLGNITNFSYTPPTGLTLSSASWNFGDGFTSSSNTPVHTYASVGTYTIIIQATFTNSSTVTDSTKIEIAGLPKASFYYDIKSDTCQTRSNVCFFDTSRPFLTGQKITSRLFVWGDGSFNQANNPVFGTKLCHHYLVADKYTVTMELTDTFGCKNSISRVVEIAENINPTLSYSSGIVFYDCKTAMLCLSNKSVPANPNNAHYEWYVDSLPMDTMHYFNGSKCAYFTRNKTINFMLIAYANNNCRDTFSTSFNGKIDTIPLTLELLDTVVCFSYQGLNEASFKPVGFSYANWYIDNAKDLLNTGRKIYFETRMMPGIHQVKVEVVRGSCSTTISNNFKVLGPFARIKAIDGEQCFSNRDVFLYDESIGNNRANSIFRWNIKDSLGLNCVSNRIKDINKNLNCNYSVDWYTKHRFNGNIKKEYYVTLWVKDTVIGCEDSIESKINMKYCSVLLDKDSVDVCQGRYFIEDIPPPFPVEYTFDSANQAWDGFPKFIDSNYSGIYDVGLKFKTIVSPWAEHFGDDSIKIHSDTMTYYDTVYLKHYLHIRENKRDDITVKVYGNCKPFRVSVHFKNGMFYKGDSLYVGFSSYFGGSYEKLFKDSSRVDSVFHVFNTTGFDTEIKVHMLNLYGCQSLFTFPLKLGKLLSWSDYSIVCLNKTNCLMPSIYDWPTDDFWYNNTPNKKVSWWFDDTSGTLDKFKGCYRFKYGGFHTIKMLVTDSFGCNDTLQDTLFVQDLRANIKHTARFTYCSELKQFFDSSSILYFKGDSIKRYLWQFGSGVFSTLQKNPLQSINTSLDKIPAAHAVESQLGCYDTIRFEIDVIGPKPYFTIRDTIGCGSLNALFINLSKNCKQYTWQYGDSAQTTYQTFSKQNVNFLYNKPGRYYISLVGIDSVFNPFTNKLEYCSSTFPDKIFQKDTSRSVLVLPFYKTGIISKDTICLGSPINFFSQSDTAYDYDYWQMGDASAAFKLNAGSAHNYQYTKAGIYSVKLSPGYNTNLNNLCRDSAQKNILVLDVKADFDINPLNVPPVFIFHNKSSPANASLRWDFGQPSDPSNTSSDQDPSHDYGMDTGTFTICLIADLPEGCSDTICKTVFNDHKESFGIYNVFTPGNIDGKNDQYDIQIENEDLYDLQIYDRWGNLVYEGKEDADNTQNINWNGKVFNKGAECPAATYYYIFRYSLKQKPGEVITLNGVIMLIR